MTSMSIPTVNTTDPQVERTNLKTRIINKLPGLALAIASVVLVLMAVIVTALVALGGGGVPTVFIAAAVGGILLAGVLGCFAIFFMFPKVKTPIPESFLTAVRYWYGDVMYNFIVKKGVTIQELRKVVRWVTSGFSTQLKGSAKIKAESFGLDKLRKGAEEKPRPLFDDFLMGHCPIYFTRWFILLGKPEFPKAKGMLPEEYWTAPLGFVDDECTVFGIRTWLLAQVMKREEYELLRDFKRNGLWHQTTAVVSDLQTRMLERLKSVPERDLLEEYSETIEKVSDDDWFRRLFAHGTSWSQIQLFLKVGCIHASVLDRTDFDGYGEIIRQHTRESDIENYDHNIALTCVVDFLDELNNSSEEEDPSEE
ncbi:DUF1389 domain-containing protein [Chlamydia vaughanii]|uniref:DUF1389 domain-containing protein n=1 Tax=Chlamydia vaughanii TaxID=3112552 RepID=UPI0032B2C64D